MAEKKWEDRIAEAERRGVFTKKDMYLSEDFATCRVGEHTGGVEPRFDSPLWVLGIDFMDAVDGQDFQKAKEVADEIAAIDPRV